MMDKDTNNKIITHCTHRIEYKEENVNSVMTK